MKKTAALILMICIAAGALLRTAYGGPAGVQAASGEAETVVDFDDAGAVEREFRAYYIPGQYDSALSEFADCWSVEEGVLKRTGNLAPGGGTVNIAMLTYMGDVFEDFELSVDFLMGDENGCWPAVGIRQRLPGTYYPTSGGGAGVFMQRGGYITLWGPLVKGDQRSGYLEKNTMKQLRFRPQNWHNMKITAVRSELVICIDETEVLRTTLSAAEYSGGYVSLISVNDGCSFDNFRIRKIDAGRRGNEKNLYRNADLGQSIDDIIVNGFSGARLPDAG